MRSWSSSTSAASGTPAKQRGAVGYVPRLMQLVADLCRAYPHELKTVYVSVDTDEKHYQAATRNRPWLSMEWNDGSSENPEEASASEDETQKPQESFLLADDDDLDAGVAATDTAGMSYVRPFSRVYMAYKLNVLLTPTLAVYSTQKRQFLDTNVRLSRLRPARVQGTMQVWLRGEPSPSINLVDVMYTVPWTTALALAALVYLIMVAIGGEQLSIAGILQRFS